jgi:hypothetical protein
MLRPFFLNMTRHFPWDIESTLALSTHAGILIKWRNGEQTILPIVLSFSWMSLETAEILSAVV